MNNNNTDDRTSPRFYDSDPGLDVTGNRKKQTKNKPGTHRAELIEKLRLMCELVAKYDDEIAHLRVKSNAIKTRATRPSGSAGTQEKGQSTSNLQDQPHCSHQNKKPTIRPIKPFNKPRIRQPDIVALAEYEVLRNMPIPSDAPIDLCIFAEKVNASVGKISALGKTHYLYNPQVMRNIIRKFTVALRYRWFDYMAAQQEEEPELVMVARFLQRQADLCSRYIDL